MLAYRNAQYDVLRTVTAAALSGYQVDDDFGLIWCEDPDGKSWFLVHTHAGPNPDYSPSIFGTSFEYHLRRMALDGASFETDFTYTIDPANIQPDDLTVPVTRTYFAGETGTNAQFAIAQDGNIWIPIVSGARAVSSIDGSLLGSSIAWPNEIRPIGVDNTVTLSDGVGSPGGGPPHPFGIDYGIHWETGWRLGGFVGTTTGIVAQFYFMDAWVVAVFRTGETLLLWDYVVQGQWQWWHLPWGSSTWEMWTQVDVSNQGEWHEESFFLDGFEHGDGVIFTGNTWPDVAQLSPYDQFLDIGGGGVAEALVGGVRTRLYPAFFANKYFQDYQVRATGVAYRPRTAYSSEDDDTFAYTRPVRQLEGKSWVHAFGPGFFRDVQHLNDRRFTLVTDSVAEQTILPGGGDNVPILTAPMSQWRLEKGPAE